MTAKTADVPFMGNCGAECPEANMASGNHRWVAATAISSFSSPVMYCPAETPEIGPVRM